MINYPDRRKFRKDSIKKRLMITYLDSSGNGHTITNSDLYEGQFELTETLCSEKELRFGCCESDSIKFKIANNGAKSMVGRQLTVTMALDGETNPENFFFVGYFWVETDKETADRNAREIVAYDVMKRILRKDITKWINTNVFDGNKHTLKQIRDMFFRSPRTSADGCIGHWVTQVANQTLVNDTNVYIKSKNKIDKLSALDFLNALCEINGVFGHITRDGKFKYVELPVIGAGLYPQETLYPSSSLTPKDGNASDYLGKANYIKCEYESFECKAIDKVELFKEDGDIGGSYTRKSEPENVYRIEGNLFLYDFDTTALNGIASALATKIFERPYRPAKVEVIGDPTLEVGDGIRVVSEREIFVTYILERTMKGIQSLRDTYTSKGVESYDDGANSPQKSIINLKNKTNILKRTSDMMLSEIYEDGDTTKTSIIKQTSDGLTAEITNRTNSENGIKNDYTSKISATATELKTDYTAKTTIWNEHTDQKDLSSDLYDIKYRDSVKPEDHTFATTPANNELYLRTSNGWLYKYSTTNKAWSHATTLGQISDSVSSQFNQTAKEITAKVSSTGGTKESFAWSLTSSGFTLQSNSSTVFKVDNAGNLTIKGNMSTGSIGSGTRNWTIGSYTYKEDGVDKKGNAIYNGKPSLNSENAGVYIGTDGIALGSNFKVDRSGNITAKSGSFTGNITCESLTLGDGVKLTDSMFSNNTISGARLKESSIANSRISSVSAGKFTSGTITIGGTSKLVEWQENYDVTSIQTKTIWQNAGGYLVSSKPSSGGTVFGYAISLVNRQKKLELVYSEDESQSATMTSMGVPSDEQFGN